MCRWSGGVVEVVAGGDIDVHEPAGESAVERSGDLEPAQAQLFGDLHLGLLFQEEPVGDVGGLKPTRRSPRPYLITAHMSSLSRMHSWIS